MSQNVENAIAPTLTIENSGHTDRWAFLMQYYVTSDELEAMLPGLGAVLYADLGEYVLHQKKYLQVPPELVGEMYNGWRQHDPDPTAKEEARRVQLGVMEIKRNDMNNKMSALLGFAMLLKDDCGEDQDRYAREFSGLMDKYGGIIKTHYAEWWDLYTYVAKEHPEYCRFISAIIRESRDISKQYGFGLETLDKEGVVLEDEGTDISFNQVAGEMPLVDRLLMNSLAFSKQEKFNSIQGLIRDISQDSHWKEIPSYI